MRLKKEINKLKDAIINMGDNASSIPIDVKSNELSDLKIVFEKHIGRVLSSKKDAVRKNKEYEQFLADSRVMQSERIVARQIQMSMLPGSVPDFGVAERIDLFADMDAADETGGDFYDYFKIDDDHICFEIADVEGKGIPAAMYMAVAKTLIRLRLESGEALSAVLSSVNRQLCLSSMQRRFITLWVGVLEISTGKLTYVNAGHNYPVLKRGGEAAELVKNSSGIPIASYFSKKRPLPEYTEFELQLKSGDVLFLYTDGITEAMNVNNLTFGDNKLLELTDMYLQSPHTMRDFTAYIKRQVLAFTNSPNQNDDITTLALRYN
ncbi:MAG: PP2C family protein-serine/threonine phosphatase [Oscillospiraceae bacterium]|nr:PP2C family protein-serine/threonine phosphatase [Oscillospiraceae bacterium]